MREEAGCTGGPLATVLRCKPQWDCSCLDRTWQLWLPPAKLHVIAYVQRLLPTIHQVGIKTSKSFCTFLKYACVFNVNVSKVCTVSGGMFLCVMLVSDKYFGRLGKNDLKYFYPFSKMISFSKLLMLLYFKKKKKKNTPKFVPVKILCSFPVSKYDKMVYVDGCREKRKMA